MAFVPNNKTFLASTLVGSLATGVGALSLTHQDAPIAVPQERDQQRYDDRNATHSGTVVDLYTYLKKSEEDIQRQIDNPARGAQEEDAEGIDWSNGDYDKNLEYGVPMVLMIEESSPWGEATVRPHIVAFDPDDRESRSAYKKLKEHGGKDVEVTGELHKEGAIRGLRVIMLNDLE